MRICWTDAAWEDYIWWQDNDKRTVKRINRLLKDMQRDPFKGIGKPEPLKWNLAGAWSRRIDDGNRLVYSVVGDDLVVLSTKDHYSDK